MNSKILIVEDEAKIREILCDYFSSKGELPVEASNGMQALELIDENEFDAVLLDIMMPGAGWTFRLPCRAQNKRCPHYFPHRPFRRGGQTAGL